jgi:multidrug efflux pump subunit AcrB
MALAAAGVLWAGWSATTLPRAFLPPFNEGAFTISMLLNPGISLEESHRVGLIAERLILEVPEVTAVGRRTGRAELDEHAEGVHASEIDVDPEPSDRPKADIVADIRARLAAAPALAHEPDKGPNGGARVDGGPFHGELAPEGATVRVFVTGPSYEPVPVDGFAGTALLVIGGKTTRVPLAPAGDGMLAGDAGAPSRRTRRAPFS